MSKGVWVATMESESYSWLAVGETKEKAIEAIVNEWQHGVGYEYRDNMTREELESYYGIYCRFIEFGKCEWE
jgi:hypothetical protein